MRLKFGRHYPNGEYAVLYCYRNKGFWKPLTNLNYGYNKYSSGTVNHPFNLVGFNAAINQGQYLTAKDLDGHLLGDFDLDGELDPEARNGWAFHSHNSRDSGDNNVSSIKKEYTFWYDLNYLGREIANIYGTDRPYGLGSYTDKHKYGFISGLHQSIILG